MKTIFDSFRGGVFYLIVGIFFGFVIAHNVRLPNYIVSFLSVGSQESTDPAIADETLVTEIMQRNFLVIEVIDGDTIVIENYDGEDTKVRIWGIDTPERGDEPGFSVATRAMEDLVEGRVVRIEFPEDRKRDAFGRLLCRVYVDNIDVGYELLDRKLAVPYSPR